MSRKLREVAPATPGFKDRGGLSPGMRVPLAAGKDKRCPLVEPPEGTLPASTPSFSVASLIYRMVSE